MQSCETIDGDIATSQRYQTAANVSVPSGATKLWSELKEMALCGKLQTMWRDTGQLEVDTSFNQINFTSNCSFDLKVPYTTQF